MIFRRFWIGGRNCTVGALMALLAACGGSSSGDTPPTPPIEPDSVTLNGEVSKGPFVSAATVRALSVSAGVITGEVLGADATNDNLGHFTLSAERSDLILIEATGRYRNELDGAVSAEPITLRAIHIPAPAAVTSVVNLNVLTHLSAPRILRLVENRASAEAARTQARDELLAAFAPLGAAPELSYLIELSLFSTSSDVVGNAYLLLLSTAIYQYTSGQNSQYDLPTFLDTVAADLASDGVLDDTSLIAQLRDVLSQIDPMQVTQTLSNIAQQAGSTLQAADINLFLDSDLDGMANAQDTDDDDDGVNDDVDVFPLDPSESNDADSDGVGDNADAFPEDSHETQDGDGDGVGDNADAFPDDSGETLDTDGDGIGNNGDNDDDGDGVDDADDAFPLDATESTDVDGDGVGDNGDLDDDNDGVADLDDAFPLDAACSHPDDGVAVGDECDATPPASYSVLDANVVVGDNGMVYSLVRSEKKILRWSTIEQRHWSAINIGNLPQTPAAEPWQIAYSKSLNALYVVYTNVAQRYLLTTVSLGSGFDEMPLRLFSSFPRSMVAAGSYVALLFREHATSPDLRTAILIDAAGEVRDSFVWPCQETGRIFWNSFQNRLYAFCGGTIAYADVDPQTGRIISEQSVLIDVPLSYQVRFLADGASFGVFGNSVGYIIDATDFTRLATIENAPTANPYWATEDSYFYLSNGVNDDTWILRRQSFTGELLGTRYFFESPGVHIFPQSEGNLIYLRDRAAGLASEILEPANDYDSDSDGVEDTQDAFPNDPAASIDSDLDGAPDQWNAGATAEDSTSGLVLDYYPADSACQILEHGVNGICNISAQVPAYEADSLVMDDAGIVYALSTNHYRVFRWNSFTGKALNPLVVGEENPALGNSPVSMSYWQPRNELHLRYEGGTVTRFDLTVPAGESFRAFPANISEVYPAGNFIFGATVTVDGAATFYSLNQDGEVLDEIVWPIDNGRLAVLEHAWDPVYGRFYFITDEEFYPDINLYEPFILRAVRIDQTTGEVVAFRENGSTYAAENVAPGQSGSPLTVSMDGSQIICCENVTRDTSEFDISGSRVSDLTFGAWFADDSMLSLDETDGETVMYYRSANDSVLDTQRFDGRPAAVLVNDAGTVVLVSQTDRPMFIRYQVTSTRNSD